MLKPMMLAVALAWGASGCGAGKPADVKVFAVVTVDATPILMYTAVYRANVGDQSVLWWVEGVPGEPMALENCAVRDSLNWRCDERGTPAASGKLMADGRYGVFGIADPEGWRFLTESEWKALPAPQK